MRIPPLMIIPPLNSNPPEFKPSAAEWGPASEDLRLNSYIYIYIYMYYLYIPIYLYSCIYTYISLYIYIYIYTRVYIRVYIYIYIYITILVQTKVYAKYIRSQHVPKTNAVTVFKGFHLERKSPQGDL